MKLAPTDGQSLFVMGTQLLSLYSSNGCSLYNYGEVKVDVLCAKRKSVPQFLRSGLLLSFQLIFLPFTAVSEGKLVVIRRVWWCLAVFGCVCVVFGCVGAVGCVAYLVFRKICPRKVSRELPQLYLPLLRKEQIVTVQS